MIDRLVLPPRSGLHKAIVLVSGGLDSATVLALVKQSGYQIFALLVDYGQRHRIELAAAAAIASAAGASACKTVTVNLREFGGSALTDEIDVPKDQAGSRSIPITYVPARNTVFLSLALAYAETVGSFDLFIGANAVDYSGYPDCRPPFIAAFEQLAHHATAAGSSGHSFRVQAPLISLSKAEIIRAGCELHVDYARTISCYDPDENARACGRCDSCLLRARGFAEAGVSDPTNYQTARSVAR